MKKVIENKETKLFKSEEEVMRYADLIVNVLNIPMKEGITVKQMKTDIDIITLCEAATENIEVTSEQLERIKKLSESSIWGIRHLDIVEFANYIESL